MALLPLVPAFACLGLRAVGRRAHRRAGSPSRCGSARPRTRSDYVAGEAIRTRRFCKPSRGSRGHEHVGEDSWLSRSWRRRRSRRPVAMCGAAAASSWPWPPSSWSEPRVVARSADDQTESVAPTTRALAAGCSLGRRRGAGNVVTLVPRDAFRWVISEQLFWNRTISRRAHASGRAGRRRLPERPRAHRRTRHSPRRHTARREPALVQEYATTAQLDGGAHARTGDRVRRPCGSQARAELRFVSLTDGRYFDGWLGWPTGRVTVWPDGTGSRTGVLCLPLSLAGPSARPSLSTSGEGDTGVASPFRPGGTCWSPSRAPCTPPGSFTCWPRGPSGSAVDWSPRRSQVRHFATGKASASRVPIKAT